MEWVRGPVIGRGSFSTVSLAAVVGGPLVAAKSASVANSSLLQHEVLILRDLKDCPQIISCFGSQVTAESDGQQLYNLLLEYVPGGSLADLLRRRGPLSEIVVIKYARSILEGLRVVHSRGYVHCDIKPHNILVSGEGEVKIADFGLAKNRGERTEHSVRGTPLYMSPESISRKEYEPPMDVWSAGCVVAEMATGKPVWGRPRNDDVWGLMMRIGFEDELPEIPSDMSDTGKDFLRRCFVKDPESRWTADMLLKHPFIADSQEDGVLDVSGCVDSERMSPRSVFSFSRCDAESSSSLESCSDDRIAALATGPTPVSWGCESCDGWIRVRGGEGDTTVLLNRSDEECSCCSFSSAPSSGDLIAEAKERIRVLATGERPNWWCSLTAVEEDEGWISVREGCFRAHEAEEDLREWLSCKNEEGTCKYSIFKEYKCWDF